MCVVRACLTLFLSQVDLSKRWNAFRKCFKRFLFHKGRKIVDLSRQAVENVIFYLNFTTVYLYSTKACSKYSGHLKVKFKDTECQGDIKTKSKEISLFLIVNLCDPCVTCMVHLRLKGILVQCNIVKLAWFLSVGLTDRYYGTLF